MKDDGRSFQLQAIQQTRGRKRLGLLGMRERVEMIGGSFAVESSAGNGTAVIARIPGQQDDREALATGARYPSVRDTMSATTVLLADDHTLVREGLRTMLKLETVGEAQDGRRAIALALEAEWYRLTPAQRWAESEKLWPTYNSAGATLLRLASESPAKARLDVSSRGW